MHGFSHTRAQLRNFEMALSMDLTVDSSDSEVVCFSEDSVQVDHVQRTAPPSLVIVHEKCGGQP